MEFRCRLGTPGGEIIEGVYVADSEARLRREFEEKGLFVLGAAARRPRCGSACLALPRRARIATREFLVFNQELATLLKAGMPLVQSLDILRRRVTNPVFKAVLDDVNDRVRAGSSLSEAFEAHGTLFPGVYTASLLAGEKSGNLEQVIRRYVAYVKVVASVRRKTVSALVYPAILLALSLVVVSHHRAAGRAGVRRVLRAVRRGAAALDAGHRRRSRPSRRRYFAAIADRRGRSRRSRVWQWLQRPGKRRAVRPADPAAAGLGGIAQKFATSQAARTLATLLGGGIPLVNAIDVSARSIGNQYMARELRRAAQQVREGRALAPAMADSGAFPDVAIKMVEVGESTGALQEMLNSLADFYDEEIETNLGRFVTLVEPILLSSWASSSPGCCCRCTCRSSTCRTRCADGANAVRDRRSRPWTQPRLTARPIPPATDRAQLYAGAARSDAGRARRRDGGARRLAERYRLEFVDLDALQHRPRPLPRDSRRPDAALRLRAVPARRPVAGDRRLGSRPTCR